MFDPDIRLSKQGIKVLAVLVEGSDERLHGRLIGRRADLSSGTLFPVLARLEGAGWISSKEEPGNPAELGRPRQRVYELTGQGRVAALEEIESLSESLNRALQRERGPRVLPEPAAGAA